MLDPITSTELAAGQVSQANGYTAIVNPGSTIAAGAGATALQAFINGGGNYVGYNAGGATSLRNAGMTTLNTSATNTSQFTPHCAHQTDPTAAGSLTTPGTAYNGDFATTNPLAWGFDEGGYIYREASGDAVFDPATLGTAAAAISYPTPQGLRLRVQLDDPGHAARPALRGRPAVRHRSRGDHRLQRVLPRLDRGTAADRDERRAVPDERPPRSCGSRAARSGSRRASLVSDATAIPKAKLPKVKNRPVKKAYNPLTDAVITVKASRGGDLKKVIRKAHLRKKIAKRVKFARSHGKVTVTIKGAAKFARNAPGDQKLEQIWTRGDLEMRPLWAWKIIKGMTRKHIQADHQRNLIRRTALIKACLTAAALAAAVGVSAADAGAAGKGKAAGRGAEAELVHRAGEALQGARVRFARRGRRAGGEPGRQEPLRGGLRGRFGAVVPAFGLGEADSCRDASPTAA